MKRLRDGETERSGSSSVVLCSWLPLSIRQSLHLGQRAIPQVRRTRKSIQQPLLVIVERWRSIGVEPRGSRRPSTLGLLFRGRVFLLVRSHAFNGQEEVVGR